MFNAKELVGDLQEMRDQGFLSDALLRKSVKIIAESDERFDWVGVFLLGESGDELWLHNYVGDPAENAKIPIGEGVSGKAVADKENQNIPDLSAIETPRTGGPDAQSELVVLIRAGDEIFGEINVDSEETAAFTEDDENAFQAVADKLAEQIMAERR
ncbi:MAG: GAF domain-containing protein [Gemmatimonadota bacterium]